MYGEDIFCDAFCGLTDCLWDNQAWGKCVGQSNMEISVLFKQM